MIALSRPDLKPSVTPVPAPARRATDLLHALGWSGMTVLATTSGVAVLLMPEPTRDWHLWVACAYWGGAAMCAVAAAGVWRLLLLQARRRRAAHSTRGLIR